MKSSLYIFPYFPSGVPPLSKPPSIEAKTQNSRPFPPPPFSLRHQTHLLPHSPKRHNASPLSNYPAGSPPPLLSNSSLRAFIAPRLTLHENATWVPATWIRVSRGLNPGENSQESVLPFRGHGVFVNSLGARGIGRLIELLRACAGFPSLEKRREKKLGNLYRSGNVTKRKTAPPPPGVEVFRQPYVSFPEASVHVPSTIGFNYVFSKLQASLPGRKG